MPVRIPDNLPAKEVLVSENIFVMLESRAYHQDIRPLKIAVLDLDARRLPMETQILRLISNSPIQLDVTLIRLVTDEQAGDEEYLERFYKVFDEVKDQMFDGLIMTGVSDYEVDLEKLLYWEELKKVLKWSVTNAFSTLFIGLGAHAALYYQYQVKAQILETKKSGIYTHKISKKNSKLIRGFNDLFNAPHYGYRDVHKEDILGTSGLNIIAETAQGSVYIAESEIKREVFAFGNPEFETLTLKGKYNQDIVLGRNPAVPLNYFPHNDENAPPKNTWRSHGNLLFNNWLNYYVYQETPYDLAELMYYI